MRVVREKCCLTSGNALVVRCDPFPEVTPKASEAASAAREQAARLGGQAETLQAQVTELMRVIASRLAVQDAKDGLVTGTVQVETTRMIPDSGSPVLQS